MLSFGSKKADLSEPLMEADEVATPAMPTLPNLLAGPPAVTASGCKRMPESERIERVIEAACLAAQDTAGERAADCVSCLRASTPILAVGWRLLAVAVRLYVYLFEWAYWVYRVLPKNVLVMIFGASLCFFGGTYVATLAAVEAFRNLGGKALYSELLYVWSEIRSVQVASAGDDDKDDDRDGIADVDQIGASELLKRKSLVALKAVRKPARLQIAIGALWTASAAPALEPPLRKPMTVTPAEHQPKTPRPFHGPRARGPRAPSMSGMARLRAVCSYLSVLATLKMQFARVVALSLGLAEIVRLPATKVLAPIAVALLGRELAHWATTLVNTLINLLALSLAWYLQTVLSAFYSGLRGAKLFSEALVVFVVDTLVPNVPDATPAWLLCGLHPDSLPPAANHIASPALAVLSNLVDEAAAALSAAADPEAAEAARKRLKEAMAAVHRQRVLDNTVVDEVIGALIFAAGFSFQLFHSFSVPFPVNLVLLPVSVIEWVLRWQITFADLTTLNA